MSANERQVGGLHYRSTLQHWDLVEEHGLGYLEGCASKYVTRWRRKGGLQDLEKADHYVEKLIELARAGRGPRGSVPEDVLATFVSANELSQTEALVVGHLANWTTVDHLLLARIGIKDLMAEAGEG